MMPDNINQNLRRGADSPPLFLCFIDQRLSFCVQLWCLFDDWLRSMRRSISALLAGSDFSICPSWASLRPET
jgi:hypothetical protein